MIRRALFVLLPFLAACGGPSLGGVHRDIERALPEVTHIAPSDLAAMPADEVVLFDVRESEEAAVSRLPGAIRVDPGLDAEAFLAAHGEALRGKTAVFYCSVGWRSSLLADRVAPGIAAQGGRAVNLRGGAFGWRNEGRLLERGGAATGDVHPYDAEWGRLIEDEAARVTVPPS